MKPLDSSDAISPVIGIVILLGVTVILSSAIGIFVIGIGQNSSADNTNTDTYVDIGENASGTGLDGQVKVGEIDELRILVDGNETQRITNLSVGDTLKTSAKTENALKPGSQVTLVSGNGSNAKIVNRFTVPPLPANAAFSFSPTADLSVGQEIEFNASASSIPGGEIQNYSWDFGDGSTSTDEIATHSYGEQGQFEVELTVSGNETTDTTTRFVSIAVTPPKASFTTNESNVNTTETVSFDASNSNSPNGPITNYEWDFDGDGTVDTSTTNAIIKHTFTNDEGTRDVTLTVTDNSGFSDKTTREVTVAIKNPTAKFSFSPNSPTTSDTITFDASNSSDPDGTISNYDWAFGDGATASNETATHSYSSSGTFTVELTVEDNEGGTNTTSQDITLGNSAPAVAFTFSPSSPTTKDTITFDGSSSSDTDGTIVEYNWTLDDGTNAEGVNPTHSYDSSGTFDVTLEIEDNEGGVNSTTQSITVESPPTAAFTADPTNPSAGDTVNFDASTSTDDGTISAYNWDFGDGDSGTGVNPSHTYDTNGTFNVTLNVTDDAGLKGSTTKTLESPIPNFTNPSFEGGTKSVSKSGKNFEVPNDWTRRDHLVDNSFSEEGFLRVTDSSSEATDGNAYVSTGFTGNQCDIRACSAELEQTIDLTRVSNITYDVIGPDGGNPDRADHHIIVDGTRLGDGVNVDNNEKKTAFYNVSEYEGEHTVIFEWKHVVGDNLGNSGIDNIQTE
jgi:PKD repeat protein